MSATHWTEIRFTEDSRIELKSGQTVRPLDDRFRGRDSGDEGPAGILVLCALGQTVPNTDPDVDLRGAEDCREVYLAEIAEIHSATTETALRAFEDSGIDVEKEIQESWARDLEGIIDSRLEGSSR